MNRYNDLVTLCSKHHAKLMLVTKYKTIDDIAPYLEKGHSLFGENYVQEAIQKWEVLKQKHPDLDLHLIGKLQTNKALDAVKLFNCIQTLDRPKLATALQKAEETLNLRRSYFIQINIGNESQKAGVLLPEFSAFYKYCTHELELDVQGIMTIPPMDENPIPYFAQMQDLAKHHSISQMSMGMSADYACALNHGSTMIRIGSLLLGER